MVNFELRILKEYIKVPLMAFNGKSQVGQSNTLKVFVLYPFSMCTL
jgi:hypothetical protein